MEAAGLAEGQIYIHSETVLTSYPEAFRSTLCNNFREELGTRRCHFLLGFNSHLASSTGLYSHMTIRILWHEIFPYAIFSYLK